LVRAALDGATLLAGAKEGEEIETLRSLAGRSLSPKGASAALGRSVFFRGRKPGGCKDARQGEDLGAFSLTANDDFLGDPKIY